MSAQQYKPERFDNSHQDVVDPDYDQGADPDYDDIAQASYGEGTDPDYDADYADPDSGEAPSQEYYKRSQK